MPVLTIGDQFPDYELTAVVPGNLKDVAADKPEDYFTAVSSSVPEGTWRVVFFWPKDFTFVCPTEIASFGDLYDEFKDRDREGIRGLGNALEAVRVREPTARVESADIGESELVVGAGPRRRTVQGVVVNDDQRAVAGDVHVELEPPRADLHGLSERGDRVLGSQGRRAPVGEDAGEFRHRCS